ncbi:hypothetical protein BZA70DRAFT_192723 [Myxozyma melibiosi]|uniref:Uncharacterized protein n=1 Tax=Myxozyma melibiosi TaxID=54550 RepID=A0ABR1F3L3_9ASCO
MASTDLNIAAFGPVSTFGMTNEGEQYHCSRCRKLHSAESFGVTLKGTRRSTCRKYERKRDMAETYDSWSEFLESTHDWNQKENFERIEIEKCFLIADLPVTFIRSPLPAIGDEVPNKELVNEILKAARLLLTALWEEGGYRYTYHRASPSQRKVTFYYYCCQDEGKYGSKKNQIQSAERRDGEERTEGRKEQRRDRWNVSSAIAHCLSILI